MIERRMKLDRLALIREVRAEKEKAAERFRDDLAAYPDAVKEWQKETKKVLALALRKITQGKDPADRYGSLTVPTKPPKPQKKDYVCRFDQTLAYLGKVSGPTVSLAESEYVKMLGRQVCR